MNADPRPRLLFVSPQFLFPMDAGGKIRSANILKNLKGGAFRISLVMPAGADERERWRAEIDQLADDCAFWPHPPGGLMRRLRRINGFASATPVSAASDIDRAARRAVAAAVAAAPHLVVIDYAQSRPLAPRAIAVPHVIFAHNVEAEILARHAASSRGLMRPVFAREAAKMARFERRVVNAADAVIAVSGRDARAFAEGGARRAFAIPTGVDLEFFAYRPPAEDQPPVVVFTGSMDWKANQEGVRWFLREVWPRVRAARGDALLRIIGKNPPGDLVAAGAGAGCAFTGFVDDVRAHARGAAFIIPLRIGGGTRIKAFEAMAMGAPVVSTALGVEGLPVEKGRHYLEADSAPDFADAVLRLLAEPQTRARLAAAARAHVEAAFSHAAAARAFESFCLETLRAAR